MAKEVLQNMKNAASEFFELPLQEKNKYAMPADDIQGYGHAYVVSEEQILDWSDALILVVYRSVSTIMGMDEDAFLGLYNDLQALRVNYYPACGKNQY